MNPLLHVINKQHKNTIKKMKRKEYEKPMMLVVHLKQTGMLMTSGFDDPTDYTNGGDPFNPAS